MLYETYTYQFSFVTQQHPICITKTMFSYLLISSIHVCIFQEQTRSFIFFNTLNMYFVSILHLAEIIV